MHGWVTHTDEFLPQPKFPSYYHHYTKVFTCWIGSRSSSGG